MYGVWKPSMYELEAIGRILFLSKHQIITEQLCIITLKLLGYNAVLLLNTYELIISLTNIDLKYDSESSCKMYPYNFAFIAMWYITKWIQWIGVHLQIKFGSWI